MRDTGEFKLKSPFEFPLDFLPVGETEGFVETVEAGSHVEISVVTVRLDANWSENLSGRVKLDFIDRYDRNPTSEGDEIDVDELWLRYGNEVEAGMAIPDRRTFHFKIGKFGRFHRQDDRHLESYGVVGTAFSRFEDIGAEIGFDLTRHLYLRGSFTNGNPLFMRDPNALAGDNGIEAFNFGTPSFVPNPDPELKSGIPVLYDSDVDFDNADFENPQVGLGIGVRFGGTRISGDFLGWFFERDLADTVEIDGTFYDGDLDLLLGPGNAFPPPALDGDVKTEYGANLWIYSGAFTLFGQLVEQDIAGLGRDGLEVEVAYAFELPLFAAIRGRQLFAWIAPAVRYSELDNDFVLNGAHPAQPLRWDWEKIDLGVRLGIWQDVDLTLEWADNEFELNNGAIRSVDEFLLTLRIGWQRDWR